MDSKRKLIFVSLGLGVLLFFLFSPYPADAKSFYHPFDFAIKNSVFNKVNNYLKTNTLFYTSLLGTHVECGGGDQTKLSLGPVIENVTGCTECQELASCAGQKKGVANVGYLWDAHTNKCGLGIVVTEAEARSCQKEDTCLGVNAARFAQIKDDVLAVVGAAPAFYPDTRFVPDAETLLALTWVESKWNNFQGGGVYPGSLCGKDGNAFGTVCGDPLDPLNTLEGETKSMDVNGDGLPDGTTCLAMPIAPDADGKDQFCGGATCVSECLATGLDLSVCASRCATNTTRGGKMGIGQILPETYLDRIQSSSFASGGRLRPNPWAVRDGLFVAEDLLAYLNTKYSDNTCGLAKYHFEDDGRCGAALTAEERAFIDEVNKFKPIMKSLLDTGACPVPVGPGPGGPLPSPCPPESTGASNLTNYISSTYNIHFDGPWSAGTLFDTCQKLYETSGTRFDDFFRNDPQGATITTNLVENFCQVMGKVINCGVGTGLHSARGNMATFNLFHELAHTIKAMDGVGLAGSGEGQIAAVAASDHGQTIWNDGTFGHISIYPWNVHDAGNTCSTFSWEGEQYADAVAYYFHTGLNQISPLCAGAPSGGIPYGTAPSPNHCTLVKNTFGSYNFFCALTLGTWQLHSAACAVNDVGSCQAGLMLQFFDTHSADAVQICRRESGGNSLALNDNCLTATTADYSVGLMQINLLGLCPLGITWTGDFSNPQCTIINQAELDKCKEKYGYGNPLVNLDWAKKKSEGRIAFSGPADRWQPWSGSAGACGLYPHP